MASSGGPVELAHVAVLRARLTPARFDKYVLAASGENTQALRLYEWNTSVSAAFYAGIGQFEILMRNALDVQLVRYHRTVLSGDGMWWRDSAMPFHREQLNQVKDARRRARKGGVPETHGKVVAELMFGFWRFLVDARHSAVLWAPALRHAFPHLRPKVRTEVYGRLVRINGLRNRIAHYEPIHHMCLEDLWEDLLTVAGWLCPTTAAWIWSSATVPGVVAQRP